MGDTWSHTLRRPEGRRQDTLQALTLGGCHRSLQSHQLFIQQTPTTTCHVTDVGNMVEKKMGKAFLK